MGKMKKSVKAIIISAVSTLCVLAIVLGLVFGLKKTGNPADNSKMTTAQQHLASQVNSSVEVKDYAITGVPYANQVSTSAQLSRFGLNYFSYKSGNRERFFTYALKEDGTYDTHELTDESLHNFVQAGAASTKVLDVKNDYVLFVSYFDLSPYATEKTKLYYSLVDISNYNEPVEIFSFDSRLMNYYIPQNSLVLKENYFQLSYLTSLDATTGEADYNFYAFPYAKTKIDYSNASQRNHVTGIKYKSDSTRISHSDSSFVIFTENTYKIYYLKDGGFDLLEKQLVLDQEVVLKDYSIKEIFDGKLLITEISNITNEADIVKTSVVVSEEGQAKAYANYSYKVYDFSKATPTETTFAVEKDYVVAHGQDSTDALNDYFYISYESVDDENELTGEYLIVYYDKDFNQVIKYEASKQNESILYAGTETFLTSNRILSVNKNVNAIEKYNFTKNGVIYVQNQQPSAYIIVEDTETNYKGLIDIDSKTIINWKDSTYSGISSVSENYTYALVQKGAQYYKYNLKTGVEELLITYEYSTIVHSNNLSLYLNRIDTDNYSLVNFDGTVEMSGITSFKVVNKSGVKFAEISTSADKKTTDLFVIESKEKIGSLKNKRSAASMTASPVVMDASSSQTATPYRSTSYSDSYLSINMTQHENPVMTINMKSSYLIDYIKLNIHFFNDWVLEIGDMYLTDSGAMNAGMVYEGDYSSAVVGLSSDGNAYVKITFSYTNWFGYSSVGIDSVPTNTCYKHYYYYYFMLTNKTEYDSTVNYFNGMNLAVTTYNGTTYSSSTPYTTAISGKTLTAPPAEVNLFLDTCFIYDWNYYGTSTTAYTFLAPGNFNTTSNTPTTGAISGASIRRVAYPNKTFTMQTTLGARYCFYYAYYFVNDLYLEVSYGGYGSDKTIYGDYSSVFSLSAPYSKPGYKFDGWSLTGLQQTYDADRTDNVISSNTLTHYYKWVDASSSYTSFTGSSYNIYLTSGIPETSVLNLKGILRGPALARAYATVLWRAAVYTITLDNGSADLVAGTQYLYEKYNSGIYFDSSCSTLYATNSNKITLPDKSDYSFAGYFTKPNGSGKMLIDPTGLRTTEFKNTLFTADATIYAYWTNVKYTIRYDNGYLPTHANYQTNTISCFYGRVYSVPLPIMTARPGYTFIGWSISGLDGQCDHYYGTTPTITSLTKITGSVAGVTVNIPQNPSTENVNITHFYNLRTTEGEIVLLSRWKPNEYSVQFLLDGGTVQGEMASFTYIAVDDVYEYIATYDTAFTIPATAHPKKTGYNFAGWQIENMEVADTLEHMFTGSGVANMTSTAASINKLPLSYTNFLNLRQTDYSVDGQSVYLTALWEEITYFVEFSLQGGSWNGTEGRTIFGMNDTGGAATPIKMNTTFGIPAPAVAPLGYKFKEWQVTANYYSGYEQTPDYTGVSWQFKKLSIIQDAVVTITVVWQPIIYNYHFEPGEGYVTLNNTDGTVAYDSTFTTNEPQRTGFDFLGWKLTGLSDDCAHYYSTSIAFTSLNGSYVDPSNPNDYVPASAPFKNLHCEEGATVTLTPMWEYIPIDLHYHYVESNYFSGIPSETQVNTIANYTGQKDHVVKINNVFTTLTVASSEYIDDGILLPAGFKLVGWVFTVSYSTHGSSSVTRYGTLAASAVANTYEKKLDWNSQYLLSLDNIQLEFYNSPGANGHDVNKITIIQFDAYAVYEPIEIVLKFYKASSSSGYNDISTYSEDTSLEKVVEYYETFTIADNKLSTDALGYMLSVNYLTGGTLNHETSITRYEAAGERVYFRRGGMTNKTWGIPNTWAYNQNDPVFYLYEVYAVYEPEKLFTYAYNQRLDGYTITGYDEFELNRQMDIIKYMKGVLEVPSTYNDGVNGSKSVVSIGSYAFAGMSVDVEVSIPSSVIEIGSYAFSGFSCTSLTGGSGIIYLERYAFVGASRIPGSIPTGEWSYFDYYGQGSFYDFENSSSMLTILKNTNSNYKNYYWEKHY